MRNPLQLAQAGLVKLANLCESLATELYCFGDWIIGMLPSCGKDGCQREVFHAGKHADENGSEWWGTLKEEQETCQDNCPVCGQAFACSLPKNHALNHAHSGGNHVWYSPTSYTDLGDDSDDFVWRNRRGI